MILCFLIERWCAGEPNNGGGYQCKISKNSIRKK